MENELVQKITRQRKLLAKQPNRIGNYGIERVNRSLIISPMTTDTLRTDSSINSITNYLHGQNIDIACIQEHSMKST